MCFSQVVILDYNDIVGGKFAFIVLLWFWDDDGGRMNAIEYMNL